MSTDTMVADKNKIAFFKPRRTNNGTAIVLEFSERSRNAVFAMFMDQNEEGASKQFNYEDRVTVALGMTDIGEILAVINGFLDEAGGKDKDGRSNGLYHKSQNHTTIIKFDRVDTGFTMGANRISDKSRGASSLGLSFGEAQQLRVFLETALQNMFIEEPRGSPNNNGDVPI